MRAATCAVALTYAMACSTEEDVPLSADAKLETIEMLREDLDAPRHPSDGGGRAWLGAPLGEVVAGSRQRVELVYEAGPLGIEVGGALVLQPSPFWGWDEPQPSRPEGPGYSVGSTDAPGLRLEPTVPGPQLLAWRIEGRKLESGERVRIVYGAGPQRARIDRFAERGARIWLAVDGDGDGVRALLEEPPAIDVVAGRPARLLVTLPSTARPGGKVRVNVALLDPLGNAGVPFDGEVSLSEPSSSLGLPSTLELRDGLGALEAVAMSPGVYRVRATTPQGLEAESNPLVVREGIPRVLWADLHGHSQLSDGTGTPADYFRYARDVAALDVAALTDHDHWGMRFLDETPSLWKAVRNAARTSHTPGRFVALSGFEWTSWLHGHRHVVYFDDEGELLSSLDPRYETPDRLWEALAGRPAVTIAHHSAGGPISTNWSFRPDPEIEPVTEIVSVHGVSEAPDAPASIYAPVPGNFVRDALDEGIEVGFVGSGDSHDGHPGHAHLGGPSGGLAAIFAEDVTRAAVLAALRERRVYATNGPRIWLRSWLMEDEDRGESALRFAVAGTASVDRVELIRSGEIVARLSGSGRRELSKTVLLEGLGKGEYVYVRVFQEDGGAAWSSPTYIEE